MIVYLLLKQQLGAVRMTLVLGSNDLLGRLRRELSLSVQKR